MAFLEVSSMISSLRRSWSVPRGSSFSSTLLKTVFSLILVTKTFPALMRLIIRGKSKYPPVLNDYRPLVEHIVLQPMAVVDLGLGDVHHIGKPEPVVPDRVDFQAAFSCSEFCPIEQTQTQTDRGAV